MRKVLRAGLQSFAACGLFMAYIAGANATTLEITGELTAVELISFELLLDEGLDVGPLGLADLDDTGTNPIVIFPITGGTLDTVTGDALIEHDGSGLFLTDGADTMTLENFFIDTGEGEMYGDVGINGTDIGSVLLFTLSGSNTMLLSREGAKAINDLFDTRIKYREKIGRATVKLTTVPVPAALPLLLSAVAGLGFLGRRRSR